MRAVDATVLFVQINLVRGGKIQMQFMHTLENATKIYMHYKTKPFLYRICFSWHASQMVQEYKGFNFFFISCLNTHQFFRRGTSTKQIWSKISACNAITLKKKRIAFDVNL